MMGGEVALQLERVSKQFVSRSTQVRALEDVTALVRRGERVALLGANGAGKTTCMDLLCGATQPTAGRVRVLGMAPRMAVRAGRLTAVLQTGGLLRDLTVQETVRIVAGLHRLPERTGVVMEEAGLGGLGRRLVGRCSGGEQQRLKYALALIPNPEVMVLDEPAAGLDHEGRASFWDHVQERASRGTTIIHTTHHLEEIEPLADRLLLLRQGRLVADRRVAELTSSHRVITAHLHEPAAHSRAVQELSLIDQVRDDGSSGSLVRLASSSASSDAVASRLLEMGGTGLVVAPRPLEDALADLMLEVD